MKKVSFEVMLIPTSLVSRIEGLPDNVALAKKVWAANVYFLPSGFMSRNIHQHYTSTTQTILRTYRTRKAQPSFTFLIL